MGKVEFGILNPMTTNYALTLENVSGTSTFTSYNNGSLPIQFKGQIKTYKNSAYENVLTTSDLSTYVTNSSLTSTLLSYVTNSSLTSILTGYVTNSSLTSTLASYVTSSSLTSTLASYVTSSSLTTTLLDYASKSVANTYTALQTFSSGLTIPSGQILTCSGTLTGGTITATTQAIANNSTNVATTAYVDKYQTWVLVTTYTAGGQTYTLSAQTNMLNLIISNIGTGNTTINITNPTTSYIGQKLKFINIAGTTGGNLSIKFPTGSTVTGFRGDNYRISDVAPTYTIYVNSTNTCTLTFTYLNITGVTWFMET
jgi:hypothetical protein